MASNPCTPHIPSLAPYPFDHPQGDLILRSSDQKPVDFQVFKLLLSLSSPFFSLLLTLPQPNSPGYSSKETKDGVPVIQMAEDRKTLEILLGFCYPISTHRLPRFSSLEDLQKVADAALKFEMDGVLRHIREELVAPRFIEAQPVRVYAIACRYSWTAEAKLAARYALRHATPGPYAPELEKISAAAYHRLHEYHRRCGEVASSRALMQIAAVDPDEDWVWLTCRHCPGDQDVRQWWSEWVRGVAQHLLARPRGETVRNFDLMSKALQKADTCATCCKSAREELESFVQILSVQIERDVSRVELSIVFEEWM